jgi:hypothetical protein
MSLPISTTVFTPTTGLSADSSSIDICKAVLDLHSFHEHRKIFHSKRWDKQYRCIIRFSTDREYGHGHLATAYLHYRLRLLYRLCGEGAPHQDERPIKSRETTKMANKRQRQLRDDAVSDSAERSMHSSSSAAETPHIGVSSHTPLPARLAASVSMPLPAQPTVSRYHDTHPETQLLTSLFSLYTKRCNASHGADFDMCNLPEKRARKAPLPFGVVTLPEPDHSVPETVAPGYAECTRKSFDQVCEWLCEQAPSAVRMGPDSVFLDVGSGYGKCVVQARIRANVRMSMGIEYVYVRYLMGMKMLTECIPSQFASIHARLGDSTELLLGDATDEQFVEQYKIATHMFMFDWVFNSSGKEGIAKLIDEASQLRVLVSCQRPDDMPRYRKLHQMRLSTGKQHPTVYFYARC